jgi:hypothetical protein
MKTLELVMVTIVTVFVFFCMLHIRLLNKGKSVSQQYDEIVSDQHSIQNVDISENKYVDVLMNKYKVSYQDYKHVMNVWQYEIDKFTKHNNRMKFDVVKFLAETYYPMVFESEFFKRYNEKHVDVTTYFEIENNTLRFKSVIISSKCKGSSVVTYDISI